MADQRLLAVFAHPDDETFRCGGTLALFLKERKRTEASLPRQRGSVPDHGNKSIPEMFRDRKRTAVKGEFPSRPRRAKKEIPI